MDQVRRRKRIFDNPVKNIKFVNGSKISLFEHSENVTRGNRFKEIEWVKELSFMEALKEVLKGYIVASCDGKVYSQEHLQPKLITDHFITSNAVTTERERKGKWVVLNNE